MGNRATVVFWDGKKTFSPAVYLHWNGGPESVYAFLEELNRRKIRADQCYECARFIQLVGEFMDAEEISGLSLGVVNGPASDKLEDLQRIESDLSDNGIYLVDRTHSAGMKVRRFIINMNGSLCELSKDQVETELQLSKKINNKYWEEIYNMFIRLQGSRPISKSR